MTIKHRCFTVCVNYHDVLAWTLQYNHHHFSEVNIITTPEDTKTQEVVNHIPNASCYLTNSFYDNGAPFAKYKGIEECLDERGRYGPIVLLDADILLPYKIEWKYFRPDILYTPRRYMCDPLPIVFPSESTWPNYQLHRQEIEFAGYCQIFHSDASVLQGRDKWHDVRWNTASGGDSEFQALWPNHLKVRPTWRCLHLGAAHVNWAGRTTNYMDGSKLDEADTRRKKLEELMQLRRTNRNFSAEKTAGG